MKRSARKKPARPCEHHFTFLRQVQEVVKGPGLSTWIRTDYFYCNRCLAEEKRETREHAQTHPAWWNAW
jgi:hypothetical protein